MDAMVKYLTDRGFIASKKYNTEMRSNEFRIERGGLYIVKYFSYVYGPQSWRHQELFLENLIKEFENYEKEKEKELNMNNMTDRINWKVKNVTFDRSPIAQDKGVTVEIEGVTKDGYAFGVPGPYEMDLITTVLQKKLNSPETNMTKTTCDTHYEFADYVFAGGRSNGKTLTQFKMYAKMLGISLNEKLPAIKKVIFNNPATIVIWADETKTVVKCQNNETYDPEKGLAMAITKKALGNEGNYFEEIKKWVTEYQDSVESQYAVADIYIKSGEAISSGFEAMIEKLKKSATNIKPDVAKREAAVASLTETLTNKKATKADLIAAMNEAISYLDGTDT